ncbi:MAG: protein kinase domain-containing protein [Prosthecobacter sp.]
MESAPDNSGERRKPQASPPPSIAELDELIPAYKFLEYLDSGGMGAVYKAVQKSLNRTVAVKLLPRVHLDKEGFADRFKREAHALAQLNHPHIIAVYDSGETRDGQMYYVMEFVAGMDLQHLLKRESPSPRRILQIISQVCDALQYAHERGIVHRDVKPANILIDERGNVKVADFGLAKIVGPQAVDYTATGTTLGTPDYIAPEAMEYGVKIDHRVDIYSLGVMIYEILTGHVPKGQWEPPSIRSGADKRIDALVSRAMQNDPDKRYQQVSDMTQVLGKLLKNCDNWKNYRRPSKISAILPPAGGRPAATGAVTQKFGQSRTEGSRPLAWAAGIVLTVGASIAMAWQAGWLETTQAHNSRPMAEAPAAAAPPATGPGPANTAESSATSVTPAQQNLLRWVFDRGGFVNVTTDASQPKLTGGTADVWSFADLPTRPFTIWRVCFGAASAKIANEETLQEMVAPLNEVGTVSNLGLRGLAVPPVALQHLASVEALTSLDLTDSSAVTAEGVPFIAACRGLKLLRIGGLSGPADPAVVQEIRTLLPDCKIIGE